MVSLHRSVVGVISIIICINLSANAKKSKYICPIGFGLAFPKYKTDDPVCYRRKGPESFEDKFKECAGNLFTSKLYSTLNFTEQNLVLWTDYKSLYPGGPFVDNSFTASTGDILITTYEVKYDQSLGLDEELCVVIDPVTNFTATRCSERHFRYCFIKPYEKEDHMDRDGCGELNEYWRFYTPKPTCLTAIQGVGGGAVRANWRQAKELCIKKGGALMSRGWRYANNPLLSSSLENQTFPLGIVLNPNSSSIRYDASSEDGEIPSSEWYFESKLGGPDMSLGALRENFWYMVNNSYIFYNVICERPITLKELSLNVSVDEDNKLILKSNDSIDTEYIKCFTDSTTFYPTAVKVRYDEESRYFILKPLPDGYYWCINIDSKNHIVSESNKALFIREKQSLINFYAILIHLEDQYKLENLETEYRSWEKKLEEYIFYRTRYVRVFGELELSDPKTAETKLKEFKASHPGIRWKDREMIHKTKIKRLFLDKKTALLHVEVNPELMAVGPGSWDDLEVKYMKPVYFCKGFEPVPTLPLGESFTSTDCRNHTCVGDFVEGVQWVTTAVEGCIPPTPTPIATIVRVNAEVYDIMPTSGTLSTFEITTTPYRQSSDSSEENTERTRNVTLPSPTMENSTVPPATTPKKPPPTTPLPTTPTPTTPSEVIVSTVTLTPETVSTATPVLAPDEQLQQVLDSLESLVQQNDSVPITVGDMENTFDQVDELLDLQEELAIPGRLLHLLDVLGGRVDLNGSNQASAVRNNIALVLADAAPENPVRGMRIAATSDEGFRDGVFEIMTEEVNETHLAMNSSEAVIQLPESVSNSTRRISFVVFRNDRAFEANKEVYPVNSKVLSINIENLTHFENGEVIDIHLTPMMQTPGRNQSRECAYWHFFEDGTGYWSQDGCIFIPSNEEGMLDTCRCNHLTHFAEVLVPRTVFSEKNERVLEVLTIIGCVMSLFGLFFIGLTAALFRSWRRDYSNKIWLQLCIAIFFVITCFLIVVFSNFDVYNVPCLLVGVALHYSVLASFCWMLVAAVLSYRRLVIVFSRDASHKLLRACAFSWGAPCAVIGILLSVDPHAYAGQFEEKTPSGSFCYPSNLGLWVTVYAPIAVMLLANWTLFALIVRSVFASRRIQRHGDTNEALRCASVSCLLVFLFGLPWIFGLFAFNVVAAYFFTLTATFQGFVLFLFFVLGNKKTRDLWLNKLKIKQTRKVPVTSSTYTHRSTGPGYRPGQGASSIETNSQKPRSLTSPDNSRFS